MGRMLLRTEDNDGELNFSLPSERIGDVRRAERSDPSSELVSSRLALADGEPELIDSARITFIAATTDFTSQAAGLAWTGG
jgi:hypothetical protein